MKKKIMLLVTLCVHIHVYTPMWIFVLFFPFLNLSTFLLQSSRPDNFFSSIFIIIKIKLTIFFHTSPYSYTTARRDIFLSKSCNTEAYKRESCSQKNSVVVIFLACMHAVSMNVCMYVCIHSVVWKKNNNNTVGFTILWWLGSIDEYLLLLCA